MLIREIQIKGFYVKTAQALNEISFREKPTINDIKEAKSIYGKIKDLDPQIELVISKVAVHNKYKSLIEEKNTKWEF